MQAIGILTSPWAILPAKLAEITAAYDARLKGTLGSQADLEARFGKPGAQQDQGYDVVDGVAVIPIHGIIAKKMNLLTQISGGVSTQLLERDFREALADSSVKAIILHMDTPGGAVDGTAELAKTIFEARGTKPVYALADGLMASAGVWIGSAADKVLVSSVTTMVGSVGVVTQHVDYSEADKKRGLKVTEIYAGKYKRIAGEHAPLSKEGRSYLQGRIDYIFSLFVEDLAKHRGTAVDDVLARMADGRLFVGQQAIDAGLADGFSSLSQLVTVAQEPTTVSSTTVDPSVTLRAAWDEDPALRARYGGDFAVYRAEARYRERTGT